MQLRAEQIMRSPRTAQLLRSAAGHEVVYGTTGSGKTHWVKQLLADDEANGREVWVIDPIGGTSLPEWRDRAARFAKGVEEAPALLAPLAAPVQRDATLRPATLTIECANWVLDDSLCRALVEQVLSEARGRDIRVRLIVNTLNLTSFGGSLTIRTSVLGNAQAVA